MTFDLSKTACETAIENPAAIEDWRTSGSIIAAAENDRSKRLARVRELSGGFRAPEESRPTYRGLYQALEEFERDLHRHIHLENNILFPGAIEMERSQWESDHVLR